MSKPNYTRAYLNEVVRFVDMRDFDVYEGKRLASIGCMDQGGIPCELHPDQVVALHGMHEITVDFNDSVSRLQLQDAPAGWEWAGRQWLKMAHGIEVDTLPEGTRVTPFTQAWLGEAAIFLDKDARRAYRGTNLDLLGCTMLSLRTWRVTPRQVVRDEGTRLVIHGQWGREETYSVEEISEEMRQAGRHYSEHFSNG